MQQGKVGLLGEAVQAIKARGLIAGVAGHSLEVAKSCEAAGVEPDFYMKRFNSKRYWSAGPMPRNDSVWEETPEETQVFMDREWSRLPQARALGLSAAGHQGSGWLRAGRSLPEIIHSWASVRAWSRP
ncbi:MAG TPA: hypothetical protein VN829_17965, partial [Dongiaceae bacterium]|nr:hypothetical protein [Dongiaceae bacterium]